MVGWQLREMSGKVRRPSHHQEWGGWMWCHRGRWTIRGQRGRKFLGASLSLGGWKIMDDGGMKKKVEKKK
jgi:hypothetical protein